MYFHVSSAQNSCSGPRHRRSGPRKLCSGPQKHVWASRTLFWASRRCSGSQKQIVLRLPNVVVGLTTAALGFKQMILRVCGPTQQYWASTTLIRSPCSREMSVEGTAPHRSSKEPPRLRLTQTTSALVPSAQHSSSGKVGRSRKLLSQQLLGRHRALDTASPQSLAESRSLFESPCEETASVSLDSD